jgi:uncharacterized protein (DUF362 family)
MFDPSRREFLRQSAAFGLTTAVGSRWLLAAESEPALLDMTIARWKTTDKTDKGVATKLTEQALAELGGMKRFVRHGDVVWIKPNIGWNRKPEQAANTNPDVVATVIRLCLEAGAKKVRVGDYTCNDAKQCYENSGIAPAAKALGADVVFLDTDRFKKMKIGGERLKDHPVYPEMVECDLLINIPICKHHGSTNASLVMKNYMGCVDDRGAFHQDLDTTIADIARFFKPRISVLDATRLLVRHGPTGGKLEDVKVLNTVAAGVDVVALDTFGGELLGLKPDEVGALKKAADYGLGKIDYRALKLKELSLS